MEEDFMHLAELAEPNNDDKRIAIKNLLGEHLIDDIGNMIDSIFIFKREERDKRKYIKRQARLRAWRVAQAFQKEEEEYERWKVNWETKWERRGRLEPIYNESDLNQEEIPAPNYRLKFRDDFNQHLYYKTWRKRIINQHK
jgi:hypothetical protein